MKIRKIRLQNVKCYSDETIAFNEGVNFISGVNGAGKTTIIESIGYALFNSKPGNISEFLRYGQKTGIITVEVEANDNRLYRVVRKFGNVNSWLVFDMETDSEVDLHGAVDIIPFFKEIFGIDPDQDPAQLFDDVIGISQGTFTAPFLESAAGRKDKFNRIFKVESYRSAYQKIHSVIKRIDDQMNTLKIDKAEKEGSTREHNDIKLKVEELSPAITLLEKQIAQKKLLKLNAENERNKLRDREKQIETTSKDINVGQERIKALEGTLEKLRADRKNAMAAAELVRENQDGYAAYINLKKEQESAEKQRKDRDGLKDSLSKNEAALSKSKAEIETENKAISIEKADIEAAGADLEGLLKAVQQENNQFKVELDRVTVVKDKKSGLKNRLEELEKKLHDTFRANDKLQAELKSWTEARTSIENIEILLTKEAPLKEKLSELEALEQQKRAADEEIAAQKQNLKTLKGNLAKTANGQCPFLDAPCQNVEEGLDAYFNKRIAEQAKVLEELELKAKQLSDTISANQSIRKELIQLENEKARLRNLEQQEAGLSKEFAYDLRVVIDSSWSSLSAQVFADTQIIDQETSEFAAAIDNKTALGELKERSTSLCNATDVLGTAFATAQQLNLEKAKELLDYSKNMAEKAESFVNTGKELLKSYDSIIEKEYQARQSDYVRSANNISNTQKQLEDLKKRSDKLAIRLQKLNEARERLALIISQRTEIEKKLSAYDGLDEKISEIQKGLASNLEAYNTYIKFQNEAAKLTSIVESIKQSEEKLAVEAEELRKLQAMLEDLKKGSSEETLLQAEKQVEQLTAELASAEAELSERRKNLDELKKKLAFMDKLKKEIKKLEEQLAYYENIRETTVFIRNILNKAGEKISFEYRKYLAGEANKIYREVSRENVAVEWRDDYELFLVDVLNGRKRERCFRQLSGGEQMTAALAMRLGLLKQLSNTGVGFFDEPTTNLDGERRSNLAQIIPQVTGNFDQLFIISHDDSFDSMTENIVQLRKDSGEGTKLA